MIHSFYIFDRHSECIYRKDWHKPPAKELNDDNAKLVFGICLSLRNIARGLTNNDAFQTYSTSAYKLHYYETPSNLKFVLITSTNMNSLVPVLSEIYANTYLDYVAKNPLSPIEHKNGEGVNTYMFDMSIDLLIKGLPGFS